MIDEAAVREDLKLLIIESLNLESLHPDRIGDDTPLFGEGLGLDSVDALELVLAIEKKYGLEIQPHEVDRAVFTCVTSLAGFVARRLAGSNGSPAPDER
jgi:acyl carrier protein